MNIFKKVAKLYTTVFGNDNSCGSPIAVFGDQNNLVDSTRALQWQVKNQAAMIEGLLTHLNLKADSDYTSLTDSKVYTFKKKN